MAADATSAGQSYPSIQYADGHWVVEARNLCEEKLTKAGMPPLTEEQEERLLDITGRLRDLPKDSTAERAQG